MQNASPKQTSDEDSIFDSSESPTHTTVDDRLKRSSVQQQPGVPVHPCYFCVGYLPDQMELIRSISGEEIQVAADD